MGAATYPSTMQLWIHEMGPAGGDEVNLITPSRNFGRPLVSNGDNYDGTPIPGQPVIGEERIEMGTRIRDIIQAPDGSVLLMVDGDDGELLRLTPLEVPPR